MKYAGMELVWLLLAYSFFGWVIETIAGTIKKKKFVNRGFSSGPFCLIYGIAAVMMTTTMQELIEYPFFLFLGCAILATIIEWFAGKLLERLNQHKWWDYSEKKMEFRRLHMFTIFYPVGNFRCADCSFCRPMAGTNL